MKQSVGPILRGNCDRSILRHDARDPDGNFFVFVLYGREEARPGIHLALRQGCDCGGGGRSPQQCRGGPGVHLFPTLDAGGSRQRREALMLGALMIQGLSARSGGNNKNPDSFWGFDCKVCGSDLMLSFSTAAHHSSWVSLIKVPYRFLFPAIMAFAAIGVYSTKNASFDVYLAANFGCRWHRLEVA